MRKQALQIRLTEPEKKFLEEEFEKFKAETLLPDLTFSTFIRARLFQWMPKGKKK